MLPNDYLLGTKVFIKLFYPTCLILKALCFGYTSWVYFKTVSMMFVPMHTYKREFMVNITFKLECTGRHTDLQLFERKSL